VANLPVLRSREQIIGDIVSGFLARRPEVNDLSRNSVLSQFFTAVGQSQFKATASVIGMLDALSVDRAIGEALQRIARDKNVPIFSATSTTGKVSVTDTSFQKIQTTVYAGQPAPVAGSLTLYVTDASKFQASNGRIYLSRGTANAEGPLEYLSAQPEAGGAYWSITLKVTSPTTKFHNIGETVTFAQGGNRLVSTGSIVQTAQGAAVTSVQFRTTADVTILDGEVTVMNVPVICTRPGTVGNVPRGAVREAVGLPFSASVFNENPFTTGREADTEDQIRARIKLAEQAKARGTRAAIEYFSQNVIAPDVQKKVQAAKMVSYADDTAALIFDDGVGSELSFTGAGFEFVVDSAVGGERELQLRNRPMAQARVKNQKVAPYNIVDFSNLTVEIKGESTTHQFQSADFKVPSAATAFEVASSVNGDPNINFLASTTDGGTRVVLYPRDRKANDIKVLTPSSGANANDILGFPTVIAYTLLLYEDDRPLFQDGLTARLQTRAKSAWSSSIVAGDTLTYVIDRTTEVTATFTLAVFQAIDPTATVSYLEDPEIWVQAFEEVMPGVTARIVEDRIELSSNLGQSNRAAIEITGGTLRDKIFTLNASLVSEGRAPDYTLNKYTGQLSKVTPMATGSKLTAGSPFTRAKVLTTSIPSGTTDSGRFWLITDGDALSVPNDLGSNTQVQFSKSGNILTIDGQDSGTNPEGFDQVQPGDWLLVWSNPTDPAQLLGNTGFWRVETAQVGQVTVDDGPVARSGLGSFFIPITDRFVFVRSEAPIQPVEFTATPLASFVNELKAQLSGVDVEIVGGAVRLSTKTADESGELFFVAADNGGRNLGFPLLEKITSVASQFGFSQGPDDAEAAIPSFTHGTMGTALSEVGFTQSDYRDLGGDDHDFVEFLDKNNVPALALTPETNRHRRAFVASFEDPTSELTLSPPQYLLNPPTTPPTGSTVQAGDRFFLRSAYQFDSRDTATVIVDEDTVTKTYRLPVARRLLVNQHSTPTQTDFSADDVESSLDLNDPSSFAGFSFDRFRAWRRANILLTDGTYQLRAAYADHGPQGNRIMIGFAYPASIGQTELTHSVLVSDTIGVALRIPVTTPRTPNWTAQTSFTVSVATTAGKDLVTYQWRAGPAPDFVAAGVVAGDVAIINADSSQLPGNSGFSAKVTSVSATAFTVQRPTGSATSDQLALQNIVNQDGTISLTFATPHQVEPNDVIALWDTAISTGITRPLDGPYTPTVTSPTTLTVPTPLGVPGGPVTGVNHAGGIVTLNITAHGLSPGNIILVSGLAIPSLNGLYAVLDAPTANTVRYVRTGALGSAAAGGRADFQSYEVGGSSASISTITRTTNVVSVATAVPHGLAPGDLVQVANTDIEPWDSGDTYAAGTVVKYLTNYYEAILPVAPVILTGDSAFGTDQITNLASTANLTPGMEVQGADFIAGTTILAILTPTSIQVSTNATGTTIGDTFTFFPQDPTADVAHWAVSTQTLNGIWIVDTAPTGSTFTYLTQGSGTIAGTPGLGDATEMVITGQLARGLGGGATPYLDFAEVGTTSQAVIDYAAQSMPDLMSFTLAGGTGADPIDTSTEDLDAPSDYLDGNITSMRTRISSRLVELTSDTDVPAGSRIAVDGLTNSDYDDEYVVLSSVQDGSDWILTVHSDTLAFATATVAQTATFVGSSPFRMMLDGDNSVSATDLASLIGSPQFTLQVPWATTPEDGEEIRLVACNDEQLVRFWSKLVVTGLTNVAKVDHARFATQLQITTLRFGSTGSIQVAGGTANSQVLAAVGASSALGIDGDAPEGKLGLIYVPYELRRPISARQWLTLDNSIREGKQVGFAGNTTLVLHGDGLEITGGSGTFQTLLPTTQDETSVFRVERHGAFYCFVRVGGTAIALGTADVKEGSWVKLRNVTAPQWSVSTAYVAGDRVTFSGLIYTSLTSNTGSIPADEPTDWQLTQIPSANQGIYRVVRTFGQDSFWVEATNLVEGLFILGHEDSIAFYSYDSVMPGDTLVVSTSIFGAENIGRYVVRDELDSLSYAFPTSTRIYTDTVPNPPGSPVLLGGEANQVIVEEREPLRLWKRVHAVGPGPGTFAAVLLDSPDLVSRTGASEATAVTLRGKLEFNEDVNFGVDAYKYYGGLLKELTRVIYGDPVSPVSHPGVRAAGTSIDIEGAIIKRIKVDLSVRIRTGLPFGEVRDKIKSAVAGYVNTLGVGNQVSLSKIVAVANAVPGVVAVAITFPQYDAANDIIPVGVNETPFVFDPTTDVTVSVVGL
jgi:uncharacterized phage protein gp47/JayE